jgi:hypothetical protein
MFRILMLALLTLASGSAFGATANDDLLLPIQRNFFYLAPDEAHTFVFVSDSGGGEGARAFRYTAVSTAAQSELSQLKQGVPYRCELSGLAAVCEGAGYCGAYRFYFTGANCSEATP